MVDGRKGNIKIRLAFSDGDITISLKPKRIVEPGKYMSRVHIEKNSKIWNLLKEFFSTSSDFDFDIEYEE